MNGPIKIPSNANALTAVADASNTAENPYVFNADGTPKNSVGYTISINANYSWENTLTTFGGSSTISGTPVNALNTATEYDVYDGTVTVASVVENTEVADKTGTIAIGGQTYYFKQEGVPSATVASPTDVDLAAFAVNKDGLFTSASTANVKEYNLATGHTLKATATNAEKNGPSDWLSVNLTGDTLTPTVIEKAPWWDVNATATVANQFMTERTAYIRMYSDALAGAELTQYPLPYYIPVTQAAGDARIYTSNPTNIDLGYDAESTGKVVALFKSNISPTDATSKLTVDTGTFSIPSLTARFNNVADNTNPVGVYTYELVVTYGANTNTTSGKTATLTPKYSGNTFAGDTSNFVSISLSQQAAPGAEVGYGTGFTTDVNTTLWVNHLGTEFHNTDKSGAVITGNKIKVTPNDTVATWKVESSANWLRVSSDDGLSNITTAMELTLSADGNTSNEDDRTATLTISKVTDAPLSSAATTQDLPYVITVTQSKVTPTAIIVAGGTSTVEAGALEYKYSDTFASLADVNKPYVYANCDWTATASPTSLDWLTYTASGTKPASDSSWTGLLTALSANTTHAERKAEITVKYTNEDNAEVEKIITITQKPTPAAALTINSGVDLKDSSAYAIWIPKTGADSSNFFKKTNSEGTASTDNKVTVAVNNTGYNWTVASSDTNWLTVAAEANAFTVAATENPNAVARTATITVSSPYVVSAEAVTTDLPITINVTQEAADKVVKVVKTDAENAEDVTDVYLDADGNYKTGSAAPYVRANTTWGLTKETNKDWLTSVTPVAQTITDGVSKATGLTIACAANDSVEERDATVTVTATDPATLNDTFTVHQAGAAPYIEVNDAASASMTLDPDGVIVNRSWVGDDPLIIPVQTNLGTNWEVTPNETYDWITATKATNPNTVTLALDSAKKLYNDKTNDRTATFTLKGTGTYSATTLTLTVTQQKVAITASPATLSFAKEADITGKTVTINSNTSRYTIAKTGTSNDWMNISCAAAKPSATATVTVTANELATSRTAGFDVKIDGTTAASVNVTQVGPPPAITGYFGTEGTIVKTVEKDALTTELFTVAANTAFTATSSADWLTITGSPFAQPTTSVPYAVTENTSAKARTATITLKTDANISPTATVTLTVKQQPTLGQATIDKASVELNHMGLASETDCNKITVTANPTDTYWEVVPKEGDDNKFINVVTGSGSGTFVLTCARNPKSTSRTGTVVFKPYSIKADGSKYYGTEHEITVEQAGGVSSVSAVKICYPTAATDVSGKTITMNVNAQGKATLLAIGSGWSLTDKSINLNSVSWSSSNTAIATIDSAGVITFLGSGTVKFTATSTINSAAAASVTVVNNAGQSYIPTNNSGSGNSYWPTTITQPVVTPKPSTMPKPSTAPKKPSDANANKISEKLENKILSNIGSSIEKAADKGKKSSTIEVKVKNDTFAGKELLEELANQSTGDVNGILKFSLTGENASMSFKGSDVNAGTVKDVDLYLNVSQNDSEGLRFQLGHKVASIGTKATVSIKTKLSAGKYTIEYFDSKTNTWKKLARKATVNKKGIMTFTALNYNDYRIVAD